MKSILAWFAGVVMFSLAVAASGFTPMDLTGCVIWLKADEANIVRNIENDGRISQWNDISGNNNHVANADDKRQPLFVESGIRGEPSVYFDCRNNSQSYAAGLLSDLSLEGAFTVFAVVQVVDENEFGFGWRRIIGSRDENWLMGIQENVGNFILHSAAGEVSAGELAAYATFSFERPYIMGAVNDQIEQRFYVNGLDLSYNTSRTAPPKRLTIGGAAKTSNDPSESLIAEVIVYERGLSAVEREQVEEYLAGRYGIGELGVKASRWNRGGGNSKWSVANNWQTPLSGGASLYFYGNSGSMENDLSGLSLRDIKFVNSSWSISGNPVAVEGNIFSATTGTVNWGLDTELRDRANIISHFTMA